MEVGFVMVFFASAAVIFWRKSDEWVALVVALFLMTFGGTLPGVAAALPAAHPDWWLPLRFVELLRGCADRRVANVSMGDEEPT